MVLKYNVKAYIKSTVIFGLIMLCLWGLSAVTTLVMAEMGGTSSSTVNGVVQVYAGVCGLVFVKETFHLMLQNGVSRKSIWAGSMAFAVVYSGMLTAVAGLFQILDLAVAKMAHMEGVFMTNFIFEKATENFSVFQHIMLWVLFTLLTVWVFFIAGVFTAALMYRLGNLGKTIFWVGSAAVAFVLLPLGWMNVPMVRELLIKFAAFLLTPANCLWFCLGLVMALGLASWPALRRASLRTK